MVLCPFPTTPRDTTPRSQESERRWKYGLEYHFFLIYNFPKTLSKICKQLYGQIFLQSLRNNLKKTYWKPLLPLLAPSPYPLLSLCWYFITQSQLRLHCTKTSLFYLNSQQYVFWCYQLTLHCPSYLFIVYASLFFVSLLPVHYTAQSHKALITLGGPNQS